MVQKKYDPIPGAPEHIAIIVDGNRRWARERGLPTIKGHQQGLKTVNEIVRAARDFGVKAVSLYVFSTENWNRAQEEVRYLMRLFITFLRQHEKELHAHQTRFVHIGRKDRINKTLLHAIERLERNTKTYTNSVLNIALDYGGRDEIVRAVKKIVRKKVVPDEVSEEAIANNLDTAGQSDPDLMIRTSGEERLSGFLIWQLAYAELYFEKNYFPDFTPERLRVAIKEYIRRERRFGK